MKKLALTSLFLVITATSLSVLANNTPSNGGGFSGPGATQIPGTVREIKKLGVFVDDTEVTLTGVITNALGNEKYTFRDSTGEIIVEIDNDKWFGLKVDPNTTVIINGEIDKGFNGTSVDVKRIQAK